MFHSSNLHIIYGELMMKKIVVTFSVLLLLLVPLCASDIALSLGTFTFSPSFSSADQGLYTNVGMIVGIPDSFEAELSLVSQITPELGKNLFVKGSLSYALLSPLYKGEGFVPMYINSFIQVGAMAKVPSLESWGPFITFTPLTTGGPQFLRKEKVASLSLYYDVPHNSVGFFFQLFAIDIYVTDRT